MRALSSIVCAILPVALSTHQATPFGRFQGTVATEWLDDGRRMRLLRDFRFLEPDSTEWIAPRDSSIDGASIPQVFWSFIGGPFEGRYRNASVVHDVACVVKTRPWRRVHRMFYLASRTGGVGVVNAKVMFGAVFLFGPHWPTPPGGSGHGGGAAGGAARFVMAQDTLQPTLSTDQDFLRMREYIRRNPEISLASIEALTRERLLLAIPEVPRIFRGLLEEPSNR